MRFPTLFLLSWATLVSTDLNAQHTEWQPAIDDIVADGRAGTVVVGFYDNGETEILVAGGPADGDSILEIGSVSKVFTSLLAQVLVDDDKLKWKQTLADSFPDLEFANKDIAKITLKELSTHTSGLPRLPSNMSITDENDPYAGYDRKLLLEFISTFNPDELDKSYEYSNYGTGLLGEIAADAAGMSYADAMRTLVLEPLGMSSSNVGLRDELADRLVKGISNGKEVANWSGFDAMAGAGAITASMNDMLTFVAANFNDNDLSKQLKAIRKKQTGGITAYAWHLQGSGSDAIHWHNGGTGGYASFLGIDTKQEKGVVVLSASSNYDGITELGFIIMAGTVPYLGDDDLGRYEGVFELRSGLYLTLFVRDERLHAQATDQSAIPLSRTGETEFRFDPANVVIAYPEDFDGKANEIYFTQNGQSVTAKRVDDELGEEVLREIEIDPAMLSELVGDYHFAPSAKFSVEIRDNRLFVMLTGQQFFEVFPFEKDKFFYKVVDAKLYFNRDESGNVVSVTLDQNDRLQTAKRAD